MKLKKHIRNFSFIFIMLVISLTLFCINKINKVDAIETNSSKLSKLEIEGYEGKLNPEFNSNTYEYDIEITNAKIDLNINYETVDSEAKVEIIGNKYIKNQTGTITITVTEPNVEDTKYKINYTKVDVKSEYVFEYIENIQEFIVPFSGYYKLETWGAQGGNNIQASANGGKGGYSKGVYKAQKEDILYVYVGGQGKSLNGELTQYGGWNGGGGIKVYGFESTNDKYNGTGGGATDISTVKSEMIQNPTTLRYERTLESYDSRLIVAGAGGGGGDLFHNKSVAGGFGGGLVGGSFGGTQTGITTPKGSGILSEATLGLGGSANGVRNATAVVGGGAGYYGGSHSQAWNSAANTQPSGGGSGYIGGVQSLTLDNINEEAITIAGNEEMPTHDGTSTVTGNEGNGYAKITPLFDTKSEDNYLSDLTSNNGTLDKEFDPLISEYTLTLSKHDQNFTISGTLSDEQNATVTGLSKYDIDFGETKQIQILVTAQSGDIRIYKVIATRENFIEGEHSSKLSKLEIEGYEGKLNPEFHPLTNEYSIEISSSEIDLNINYEAFDSEATVKIQGNKYIKSETGTVTITVSAPNVEDTIYRINYNKDGYSKNGIINWVLSNNLPNGNYDVSIDGIDKDGNNETITYKVELINYYEDVTYTTNDADENGYIKLGDNSDEYKMLIVKYHGNLMVEEGVTLTTNTHTTTINNINYELTYKKGMYIHVNGTLTNNGTISMTARGTYNQEGENVYLLRNEDGTNEYVPAVGGAGASSVQAPSSGAAIGEKGEDGINRQTGGGGSGSAWYDSSISGAGGNGTSYSGGSGGAGVSRTGTSYVADAGSNIGGPGGNGYTPSNNGAGGGAGNPGGKGAKYGTAGETGTGGLIILFSKILENNGTISSNGSLGGTGDAGRAGSSGGGSINVFYGSCNLIGKMEANGGNYGNTNGGNGGNGSITQNTNIIFNKDNYLSQLIVEKNEEEQNLNPKFDPTIEEYNIQLGVNDTKIKIEARPSSDLAVIEGIGEHDVPSRTTTYPIIVTAESGDVRTYNVNVTREASSESKANNIEITGLVPSICEGHAGYCKLDTEFEENKNTYYMTVPAGIREVEFTVDKKHDYQEVIGEGITKLSGGENNITIEITSEDGKNRSVYNYEITRDMTGDNYIDKLEIVNPRIDIGFNYLITEYAFKVENSVTNLDMDIELDDENASYEVIGNSDFKVGNNVVEIRVTAQTGEIRSYILNVYRVSNSNALLESLEVKNGETKYTLSPEFEDIKTNYTLNVGNDVTKVTINGKAQASTTTVSGLGEKELKVGLNQYKVILTAEDGSIENYTIIITREKNSNNYLKKLNVSEGVLNETFNKEIESYSITVNPYIKSLTLDVETEVVTSKIKVEGNNNFKIGENVVTITVTAENGTSRKYYIIVTKEGSENNYLSSLSINNGEIPLEFNKETLEYNIEVENDIKNITISGEKEDTLSKVSGLGSYKLKTGLNQIQVRVTSETGKTRDYIINIRRKYNEDADLREIILSSGTLSPEFNKETLEYTVNVENEIEKITVRGVANTTTTIVEGNKEYTLNTGSNEIIIKTTSESGKTKEYKINVIRDISSNANLSSLIVKEGALSPTFNKMIVNYRVKVLNEVERVNVVYEKEKETSEVNITGTENLVIGENIVNVVVTAEDGSVKTYEIIVERQEKTDSNLNLRTLDVTSCTLNPEFDKEIQYYECEVGYEVTSVTVNASLEDETNSLTGTGLYNLKVGKNVLPVRVINSELLEKDYQVVVTRKESTESRLNNIKVENHTLNEIFDKDKYNYSISTEDNSLTFNIDKLNEKQKIEIIGNENFTLGENIVEIIVTSADKLHFSTYTITVTKEKSSNNYLSNLFIEDYKISPEFKKGTLEYNLTVENEVNSVIVDGEKEDINSIVEGFGMHTLEKGKNEIKIKVTSESGIEREYKINVTRLGSRNNNLSNLEVKNHSISPEFKKETLEYNLEVEYEESEIEIQAEVEEENAIIIGDGIRKLEQGINILPVIVTSENGEVKTYKVKVTRKDPVTSLLKNIEVKNYNLDKEFESSETNYIVVVDNEIEKLELLISKLDPNSTYIVEGNENFVVGLNEVRIISRSSNGVDETTYTLTVNRQSYSNTYLNALSVSEGELSPEFNKTTLAYEVTVENEIEKITINASAENIASTVIGTGEKTLNVGENKFNIIVTSAGGIRRTYIVKVIRKGSNNANISKITTNIGTITKLNETSYKLVVPNKVTEIREENIIVTTEDERAIVEKEGTINLSEDKEYLIKVISPDGSITKEYIIYVEYELSSDATLKELSSSAGEMTPEFKSNVYKYIVNVLDTVKEIELKAVVNDEKATIINDTLVYELKDYRTKIEISVQAEDGTVKIYTVDVEKSITTEKYLENIEITGIKDICTDCSIPEYNETTYEYNITVPNEVKEIGYEFTKKHPNQEIKVLKEEEEVNEYLLSVGINTFKVKVKNGIGNETVYTYNIERLRNTNNYLKSLKIISPEKEIEEFEKEKLEYNIEIPNEYENISIEAKAEDELNAKVKIEGYTYLLEGNNDVTITVTAENGDKRIYILHVLRTPGSNNLLKTLTVSSGDIYNLSPKFMPGITEYTLKVPSMVSKVSIEGIAEEENAEVIGNGEYDLKVGLNEIIIKVISIEKKEKEYKIKVTRESSKNVYLSDLIIKNGIISPEFKKETNMYTVDIKNTEEKLNLEAITEDKDASYEIIGNENLRYGKNIVQIKVTSSDKSVSRIYTLEVNKEGEGNNNLLRLTVDDKEIEGFDPNITEYNIEVENIKTSIVVDGETESEYAYVNGLGMHSLKEGLNEIKVKVISQNNKEKVYTINVTRKLNTYLSTIVIDEGKLTPEFKKETLEYSVIVENSVKEITVIGLKEDNQAEVIGNGKYTLKIGENEIKIKVVNGKYEREYKIVVTRKGSENTYLEYLTVAEGQITPVYEKEIMNYTVYIPDDKTSVTVDYKVEDESSIVEVIGNENLNEKENEVIVRVTSTSTKTRDYVIKVIREEAALYSNKLKDLSVNKGTMSPKFDSEINEYTVTVGNNVEEINVNAIRESVESKVIGIGAHKLVIGRNVIQVLVLSKDNKQRVYTLIVYRSDTSDARLLNLEFNEGTLSPTFNKNVYEYTLKVNKDSNFITIKEIKTAEENATYEIVKIGEEVKTGNIININVTSKDGKNTKTYKITLKVEKLNNVKLSELTVNVGELKPIFDKEKYVYKVEVENSVKSIVVSARAESLKAIVTGTGLYELETGENYINVVVTSENGISNIYSVEVTRKKSNNNNLKDLYIRGYNLDKEFKKDITEYSTIVESDIEKITLEGEVEDISATAIGLKEYTLKEGLNEIEVIVTAEDGSIKTYKVKVTRKEKISSKIKTLEIEEGELNPEFTSETYEYYINIPNEYTRITPKIKLEDEKSRYEVIGNENLVVGENKVQIKVTDIKGNVSTYIVTVIRNILSNNYLSKIEVDKGILSPEFNKETLNYEVTVENEEEIINVNALPELTTTTVIGIGQYPLKVGENIILVKGISESGIERVYKIKVIRKGKDNNYLSNIILSNGTLDKEFDKEILDYEAIVEEGLEKVEVTVIKEDETARVEGNGIYNIEVGNNNIKITVTSEQGNVRIYNVTVKRPIGTSTKIKNITPSIGELSPEFDNETKEYEIRVDKNTNIINFDVELESKTARVEGNENILIDTTEKEIKIIVTAENGDKKEITIKIKKESEIEDIILEKDNIIIGTEEEYQIEAKIKPETVTNKELVYEVEDEEIVSVDETGKIIGQKIGTTNIKIKSKDNEKIEKILTVKVVLKEIKSTEYSVEEKEEGKIVIVVEAGEKIEEFIENLENDVNTIKIYDKEENKIEDYNEIIKTGLVVKLIIDKVEYDKAIIIVRGDINEDGIVDISDKIMLQNHILIKEIIEDYRKYALDVENDELIDISDNVKLGNYILKKLPTLK